MHLALLPIQQQTGRLVRLMQNTYDLGQEALPIQRGPRELIYLLSSEEALFMWYKIVKDGYITVIGKGSGGTQISEAEYNDIMTVMKTVPTAQNGYAYRLKENLTWELYEVEITDDPDIISDTEALKIITEGNV